MLEKKITIKIPNGLHARPAAQFVYSLKKFSSTIEFLIGGRRVNAKSILQLMTTNLKENDEVHIIVNGIDEITAMEFIDNFFTNII